MKAEDTNVRDGTEIEVEMKEAEDGKRRGRWQWQQDMREYLSSRPRILGRSDEQLKKLEKAVFKR